MLWLGQLQGVALAVVGDLLAPPAVKGVFQHDDVNNVHFVLSELDDYWQLASARFVDHFLDFSAQHFVCRDPGSNSGQCIGF